MINNVTADDWIVRKFILADNGLVTQSSAKRDIARTEKINTRRSSSPPTLIKAGNVTINVSYIICKLFCFLKSLNILRILKTLSIAVEDEIEEDVT